MPLGNAGTAGQVLTSAGAGVPPTWAYTSGTDWSLTGNANTIAGTNFIGTTDANALLFKVNNQKAGYIDFLNNTSFGQYAQNLGASSGINNTAVGFSSSYSNVSGGRNTSIGSRSLYFNTTGDNTAVGYQTLYNNSIGSRNTGLGEAALQSNDSGNDNVAVGYFALKGNAAATTTQVNNVALGSFAGFNNQSGTDNFFSGFKSGYNNSTGSYNLFIGNNTGFQNRNAGNNIFFGYNSGYNNDAGGTAAAHDNIFMGNSSGYNNSTGFSNVFMGNNAGFSNSSGNNNTFLGFRAGYTNSSGAGNIAVGENAGYSISTGLNNVIIGTGTALNLSDGSYNTISGTIAGGALTHGSFNTFYGEEAGGYGTSTGNYDTYIGSYANAFGNYSNSLSIGYASAVGASNQAIIGNTSVTSIGGQVGWTNFSDGRVKNNIQENVPGLTFINALRPVTFHYDLLKEKEMLGIKKDSAMWQGKYDIEKIPFSGFIAQEVDAAATNIGYNFSGIDKVGKIWGLRYSEFIPSLVKAIQEQQKIIENLTTINAEQDKNIEQLKVELKSIQSLLEANNSKLIPVGNTPQNLLSEKK